MHFLCLLNSWLDDARIHTDVGVPTQKRCTRVSSPRENNCVWPAS